MESQIRSSLCAAGTGGWKINKLRKKVFAALGATTTLVWDDYKSALEALVQHGTVIQEGELVRLRAAPPAAAPAPAAAEKKTKKTKREPEPPAADADADARRDEKRRKVEAVAKKARDAGAATTTVPIPSGFVPFLLRAKSAKLHNIETNSKTHIQISKRDETDDDGARTLTISGDSEKRLATAKVLLGGMIKSFERRANRTEADADAGKGGGRGKGRGKGGGRGRGRGKGSRGKGGARG